MKAVDTNVIVRYVVDDEPAQTSRARAIIQRGVFVPWTVLLETGWVLGSNYGMSRAMIADAFERLLDLPTITVTNAEGFGEAILLHRAGADLADAIHLITVRSSSAFVTFDRALAKLRGAPVPIELA